MSQLRRGADRADIYSIAFSANAQWLACSSDKGTVHVFGIKAASEEARADALGPGSVSRGNSLQRAGSSSSLLMAGSALLSYAATNAGSSLSFMKGHICPSYLCFLPDSFHYHCCRLPDVH